MSGPKVFDRDELRRLLEGDEQVLQLVIDTFVSDIRRLLLELRHALENKDAVMIRQLGHALKGITASICAEAMHEVAIQIQIAGEAGDMAQTASLIDELEEENERFITETAPDLRQGES